MVSVLRGKYSTNQLVQLLSTDNISTHIRATDNVLTSCVCDVPVTHCLYVCIYLSAVDVMNLTAVRPTLLRPEFYSFRRPHNIKCHSRATEVKRSQVGEHSRKRMTLKSHKCRHKAIQRTCRQRRTMNTHNYTGHSACTAATASGTTLTFSVL